MKKVCEARRETRMMPYFFLQATTTSHQGARDAHPLGADGAPEGMATIDIAVEALKCAEYLTPMLQKALA